LKERFSHLLGRLLRRKCIEDTLEKNVEQAHDYDRLVRDVAENQSLHEGSLRTIGSIIRNDFQDKLRSGLDQLHKKNKDVPSPEGRFTAELLVGRDEYGLRYAVAGVKSKESTPVRGMGLFGSGDVSSADIPELWPESFAKELRETETRLIEIWRQQQEAAPCAYLYHCLPFFGVWQEVTTKGYGWGTEKWLTQYQLLGLPEVVDVMTTISTFFSRRDEVFREVIRLCRLVLSMRRIAERHNLPLTMPTLVPQGHIIAFESLAPVYLARQNGEELVSITGFEPLAGSTVLLMGDHGGGKTVCCKTILHAILLAQMGLPVFGEGMRWSMRKTLGIALLGRREGISTMQEMGTKLAKMLRAISEVPKEQLLLIMDEMGSGTSETNGFELSKRVLGAVARSGVDVLSTTQSARIAEELSRYGAVCYRINREHRITSGIGEADLKTLLVETGVADALEALEKASLE